MIILFLAPISFYFWPIAQNKWLILGMTPAASQAFRRTVRQDQKIRIAAENRIRGIRIIEEE